MAAFTSVGDGIAGRYDITVKQDFTRVGHAVIGRKGGTLQTQDADGNTFVLTIAPNALSGDTPITLTPVAHAADNFPFPAGITAGVQIEPEGTILWAPSTLKITLVTKPVAGQVTPYCQHEDGVDFHLCAPDLKGNDLIYTLHHFSGFGASSSSTSAAQQYADENPPSDRESAAEQSVGALKQSLQERLANGDSDALNDLQSGTTRVLMNWTPGLEHSLDDLARASYQSPLSEDQMYDYASEYMAWHQYADFSGQFADDDSHMQDDLAVMFDNTANQSLRDCWGAEHSAPLSDIINKAIHFNSMATALNLLGGATGTDERFEDLAAKLSSCLTFTMDFHSGITTQSPRGKMLSQFDGQFKIFTDQLGWTGLKSDAGFHFTSAGTTMAPGTCTVDFNHSAFPAKVMDLSLAVDQRPLGAHGRSPVRPGRPVPPPAAPNPGEPTGVFFTGVDHLIYDMGKPLEAITMKCQANGQVVSVPIGSFWSQGFQISHSDEITQASGPTAMTSQNWTPGPMDVRGIFATKDYNRSTAAGPAQIQEVTSFKLTHTPQGQPAHNPPDIGIGPLTPEKLRSKYETLIKPSYASAETDDFVAQKVETAMERWYVAAMGAGDTLEDYRSEARSEVLHILDGMVNRAATSCASGKPEMGARIAHWIHWADARDFISRQPGYQRDDLKHKVESCVRFSLNFKARVSLGVEGDPKSFDGTVTASNVLKSEFDLDNNVVKLSASIGEGYTIAHFPKDPNCDLQATPQPSTLTILESKIKLGTIVYGEESAELVSLRFTHGDPSEGLKAVCNGGSSGAPSLVWTQGWFGLHSADQQIDNGSKFFVFSDWTMGDGGTWATKSFTSPAANLMREETELKLQHQPGE